MKLSTLSRSLVVAAALLLATALPLRGADEGPKAYAGMHIAKLSPEERAQFKIDEAVGGKVESVQPDGPADKAGMKEGDIITAIGEDPAPASAQFAPLVMKHKVGEAVDFAIIRDGKPQVIKITLGELPAAPAKPPVTLKVGDAAPELAPAKWLQGDPITGFDNGKIYVVEFWATWCPPCRASIPHLSEMNTKFKDKGVVFIGQDCFEQSTEGVPDFVKKMGDKMNYNVALDTPANTMATTWLEAAGQNGIPCAFVIDQTGKIAWIGHPMAGLDKEIESLLEKK